MRKPKYLSPSALHKFEENRDEFYLSYLADNRPPRIPQTEPMSVGSGFDSFCKADLYNRAFGGNDEKYTFDYLFTRSVEPHNRDFALATGKYVYDCYVKSGAFETLDGLIKASEMPPQFEFEIQDAINGVPLMGKPDCRFFHQSGAHIILDWKVNGVCSKYPTSPCKHYSVVQDGWDSETAPPSRGVGKAHPEFRPIEHLGVTIHEGWLEDSNPEWATQLSTYGWMLGEAVGDEQVIMAVHQIVAKPAEPRPLLRVAQFASRVSKEFQKTLLSRYKNLWTAIEDNHLFTELPADASRERCELLDQQATVLTDDSAFGRYVNEIVRG